MNVDYAIYKAFTNYQLAKIFWMINDLNKKVAKLTEKKELIKDEFISSTN